MVAIDRFDCDLPKMYYNASPLWRLIQSLRILFQKDVLKGTAARVDSWHCSQRSHSPRGSWSKGCQVRLVFDLSVHCDQHCFCRINHSSSLFVTQQTHDVAWTSPRRRHVVATSWGRPGDVACLRAYSSLYQQWYPESSCKAGLCFLTLYCIWRQMAPTFWMHMTPNAPTFWTHMMPNCTKGNP